MIVARQYLSALGREAYSSTKSFYDDGAEVDILPAAHKLRLLSEAETYSRPEPRLLLGPDPAFLEMLPGSFAAVNAGSRTLPPCQVVELEDAAVHCHVLYVRRDGRLSPMYETQRANDRPYAPELPVGSEIAVEARPDLEGRTPLYLASVGSENYGHWLVDDLSRLAGDLGPVMDDSVLFVSSLGGRLEVVKQQSISALLGDQAPPVRFISPGQFEGFPRLRYITPNSHHPVLKSPTALGALRARIASGLERSEGENGRLFVTRGADLRGLTNLETIQPLLDAAGYRTIDCAELAFDEQARAFAGADRVIGIMGAAMTNTLFCPAGARIGHLAPNGWSEPFYWDLAACLGHEYSTVFGASEPENIPAHLRSFAVDPAHLAALIEDMERPEAPAPRKRSSPKLRSKARRARTPQAKKPS